MWYRLLAAAAFEVAQRRENEPRVALACVPAGLGRAACMNFGLFNTKSATAQAIETDPRAADGRHPAVTLGRVKGAVTGWGPR
jgi:hypothetical protein